MWQKAEWDPLLLGAAALPWGGGVLTFLPVWLLLLTVCGWPAVVLFPLPLFFASSERLVTREKVVGLGISSWDDWLFVGAQVFWVVVLGLQVHLCIAFTT